MLFVQMADLHMHNHEFVGHGASPVHINGGAHHALDFSDDHSAGHIDDLVPGMEKHHPIHHEHDGEITLQFDGMQFKRSLLPDFYLASIVLCLLLPFLAAQQAPFPQPALTPRSPGYRRQPPTRAPPR